MAASKDKVIVEAVWQINDKSTHKIKALSREVRLLGAYATNTRAILWSMGAAAVPAIMAAGVVKLTKSVIQENQELENMRFTLGAMLYQAQGIGYITGKFKDLNDAMKVSNKIYDDLYKHSLRAVGTVDDYVKAFRDIHRPVLQAGGSLAQAQEISKLAVPLAQQFMPQDVQAGYRDIQQYLMGRMTQRDVLTRMLGLPEAETSNKLRSEERLALLVKALETGRDAMKAQGGTFNAILDTFKGNIQQMQRIGGLELFDTMKSDMDAVNTEFQDNNSAAMAQAKVIGHELTTGYTMFKNTVVWSVKHFQEIKRTTEFILRAWLTMKAAEGISAAFAGISSLAENFKKFGGTAALANQGVIGLTANVLGLSGAVTLASASVLSAAQVWYKIISDMNENIQIGNESNWLRNASTAAMIQHAEEKGLFGQAEFGKKLKGDLEEKALRQAKKRFNAEYGDPDSAWNLVRQNYKIQFPNILEEERANVFRDYIKQFKKKSVPETPDTSKAAKDIKPPDFRGSHITIMVDSRHSDPNRVAATVVNELSKMARARTGANTPMPGVGSGR